MDTKSRLFAAVLVIAASAAWAACSEADPIQLDGDDDTSSDDDGVGANTTTSPGTGGMGEHPGTGGSGGGDEPGGGPPTHLDYFEELPVGAEQFAALCARGHGDRFFQWYCAAATPPTITSLETILEGVGLKDPAAPEDMRFVLTGHSSSLVGRRTTVLNPRAVIFSEEVEDYVAVGFVRGDGLAEIAAFDTVNNRINLYLVRAQLPCGDNCTNADRYLPSVESGWQAVDVYFDDDIKNTPLDCLQCHEPGGKGTGKILRMQELQDPWTHFFRDNRGTRLLLDQFQAAHPGEDYAGIPAVQIIDSQPADLEDFIRAAGFGNQPNEFDGDAINNDDPDVTTPNAAWTQLYDRATQGLAISPPFFGINPFDPAKVASAGAAYRAVANGSAGPDTLPDMTDLFAENAKPYLGFVPMMGADAKQIVQHRCGTCHDGRFPGISRDNFKISEFPDQLTAEMKAKVMERINLPVTSRKRMPPIMFSELQAEHVQAIEGALQ